MNLLIIQAQEFKQTQQNIVYSRESVRDSTPSMPESRCTIPKTAKTDAELSCLKGNVHTVKIENAVFVKKGGNLIKTAVSQVTIATFDKKGNLTERLNKGTKDYGTESSIHRIVYTFDLEGKATGWEEYNEGKPIPVKDVYIYDDKGNRVRQTVTYPSSREQAVLLIVYDSMGNKIEERGYYPVPTFNENKNNSKPDEKYFHKLIKYNYQGKTLTEIIYYYEKNVVTNRVLYTYENGNIKEVVAYALDKNKDLVQFGRTTFEYDEKDNIIEKLIYKADNSIETKHIKGYDNNGFITSHIVYDSKGEIKSNGSLTYNYDSHGNWLSYTTNERYVNQPFPMELRTITYY
jgi:hypothetical protein